MRLHASVIGALTLALSIPAGLTPIAAAAEPLGRPDVPGPRVSKVTPAPTGAKEARERVAKTKADNAKRAQTARAERAVTWPKPSAHTRALGAKPGLTDLVHIAPVASANSTKRSAVKQAAPAADGTATVKVLDQKAARKAGIIGLVFTASVQTPGAAKVTVDYESFASAVGGNWGGRLGLVSLPACALTTPHKPACRKQTPLPSTNDTLAQTVTARTTIAAATISKDQPDAAPTGRTATVAATASASTVMALTATSSSSERGDHQATPLSSSATWEAGSSSGSYSWSYPITTPPAAAGPAPSLTLSYDSGSIDGRTANTNNQGSQVGTGFDLTSSYIERKYGSCDDDGQADKSGLCWKYENATLVLNGQATELVKDDTTGTWRLKNDDASKVTHKTGAANGDDGDDIVNGTGDGKGEYWTVTTGDGTVYTFGLNKLPGAGTERTNSVWTVPVFGDDADEPGYSSGTTFAGRAKTQAWRWNLDFVQDVHGNASTYWYTAEGNHYAKNGDKTNLAAYTRGGYLKQIQYGQRTDTLFTGVTASKIDFTYAERCLAADCSSLNADTADNWPDVPFDAICSASETNCISNGPAFFTRKRLTGIDTSVWSTAAEPDAFKSVDSYKLTQEFLDGQDIGNSSDQSLTLKSLQRTGKNGTAITLPAVNLTYHMRPNRVDSPSDNIAPVSMPRLNQVDSETGAITTITMSAPECVIGSKMPAAEDNNNLSCFPVYWPINGGDPALDWFHKYNVTAVTVSDPAGNNEALEYSYTYETPGWHYNDDPLTKENERTWSTWRGYQKVTAYTGDSAHPRSKTVKLFMQGMHGDKLKNGTTRTAVVKGIDLDNDPSITTDNRYLGDANDLDVYAGQLRQQITYNGATAISNTFNSIWAKQTASQQKSYAHTKAYFVRTSRTYSDTYLTAAKTWRTAVTSYTYDDTYGMPTRTENHGDWAKAGDETCTRTWYARNPDAGLTSLVSRTRTVGSACLASGALITDDQLDLPANSDTPGDVLSDTATVYDTPNATGWIADQTPSLGLPTWTGRAKAYPAPIGTADRHPAVNGGWQTVSRTTYDTTTSKLGRPISITNADGQTVTTTYYPAATGPLTSTIVTAPKLESNGQTHKTYTYVDPARGSITRNFDANLKRTENSYDALGRITATWLPNRDKSAGYSASATYAYHLTRNAEPWTSTSTLKADGTTYQTSYALSDSLLRPLQTQTPSPLGGRILTDTRYDSRGLAYETYGDIYDNANAPNGTYTRASYAHTPVLNQTTFDAAARPTTSSLLVLGVKKWETTTSYTGDSVGSTAVQGGTATRTITDALGRTTETRTYSGTTPADTQYGAATGTPYTSVSYTYARDGKQTQIVGPDSSKWTYKYDLFGRQTSATDPDSGTRTTTYTLLDQILTTTDARNSTLIHRYDEIGRKTGLWQTSQTDSNKLATWTYDTLVKGLVDSSTRYVGGINGKAYTRNVTEYDSLGREIGTNLVLPSDDPLVTSGAVPATISFGTAYRLDGTVSNTKEPAAGGLPAEIVSPGYNAYGFPIRLSGTSDYLLGVSYSALGRIQQMALGTSTAHGIKKAYLNYNHEEGTGRLLRSTITDETHPWTPQNLNYTYDQAGNVTSISDTSTLGGTSKADHQCFTYDGQRRLTEAWTPKSNDCSTTGRTTANLDGPAPYWTSYTYNTAGQRSTETQHATDGTTTRRYCYNGTSHALIATTTGDCAGTAAQYAYDAAGNTTRRNERTGATTSQTLGWNSEGNLSRLTENATSTDYVYDADGELLIRRTTGGETVLYLGSTEVHATATKSWANRYYTVADTTVAVRSSETGTPKVSWLGGDHHGTQTLALAGDETQTISKRYTSPFGAERGTPTGTWPDDKGFLGKTHDESSSLTHIGARQYDPSIGQFISVDPLLIPEQHQSLNGYSYANQHPTTTSDPSGLCEDPGNGRCHQSSTSGSGRRGTYDSAFDENPGVAGGGWGAEAAPAAEPEEKVQCYRVKCSSPGAPINYGTPPPDENFDWSSLLPDGPLVSLLQGDWEETKRRLFEGNCDPDSPIVCEQHKTGTVDVGGAGALGKTLTKAVGKKAAKNAAKEILSGKIKYGENFLSRAVILQRLLTKDRKGNFAAAVLEDGSILLGRSKGKGRQGTHAEEDILNQANGRKILSLYSERDPCAWKCAGKLAQAGVTNITWSFTHNGGAAARAQGAREWDAAMDKLFQ
ncbi:RHS repeat-associated core domain-containing protein [Streptomyces xantholiticus]|uniref:RHS repeat-associated core domain-containing protein n=1 Tax=Streptomyces xantholiticus TaxID=68285 RepID=A0ABV1V489_9ACTN